MDGLHGPLCEGRHEPFCLNQCSGHGACEPNGGGYCRCERGYFGVDCSMTSGPGGRVVLHEGHAARRRPRSPTVYVYELHEHTTLILQYRNAPDYCVHRLFSAANETLFSARYAYTVEVALHERFLNSEHRTLDASAADFYFVPSYLACVILPVYDFTGHAEYMHGYPMRPITAMRMSLAALHTIRARFPYWNASGGTDHLFLFAHDEGACW